MEQIIKQAVGIDCAKSELVVCIRYLDSALQPHFKATAAFTNDHAGFDKLNNWVIANKDAQAPLQFIVEATGVYHEKLCCYLTSQKYNISVVLPVRAANFMRTLSVKTINDKVSADALAIMGLEKKLDNWQIPNPQLNLLKQLSRERTELLEDTTSIKNQIHALNSSAFSPQTTLKRLQSRIEMAQAQLKDIEQEMKELINSDTYLKERFENVCSIKGVGLITAIIIVAETDGFNLIRNQRQLVSYAGLDIIKKQSGTSINTPGKISHRGNVHIRRALHFPALAAKRFDSNMQEIYGRLLSKHNVKMKAAVAIQRKLLVLIYTIWKKNEPYNPKYLEQSKETALTELAHGRS